MASNGTMILCDGLVKIYKVQDLEVVALEGLDMVVDRGEFMAIIGPSGSGKSSLLNILGGLDLPSAGKVIVDGQDMLRLSTAALTRYRRNKVGFLWQQPARNLIPYLSVEENASLPMLLAGKPAHERKEWTREVLEAVGLWDRRAHTVHQLSGGEQQRTAIAVALANKPVLLLADEPTGEVDTTTADTIFSILRELNEAYDLTVITVTHDIRIADKVDRVVSIRDGKTSSERFRQVHVPGNGNLRGQGEDGGDAQHADTASQKVTYHEFVVVDSAGRLQLPKDYIERLKIKGHAEIELTDEGILVRPATSLEGVTGHAARASRALDEWELASESSGLRDRMLKTGQRLWQSLTRKRQ